MFINSVGNVRNSQFMSTGAGKACQILITVSLAYFFLMSDKGQNTDIFMNTHPAFSMFK